MIAHSGEQRDKLRVAEPDRFYINITHGGPVTAAVRCDRSVSNLQGTDASSRHIYLLKLDNPRELNLSAPAALVVSTTALPRNLLRRTGVDT